MYYSMSLHKDDCFTSVLRAKILMWFESYFHLTVFSPSHASLFHHSDTAFISTVVSAAEMVLSAGCGVAKSDKIEPLHFHFHALEKEMAPQSSTLAWKIPWTEEPGRLQSMGSLRVGHDWATSLSLFTFMHWRRKWQPTPVFLPGKSRGQRNLPGYSPWGLKESSMTK